VHEDDFVLPFLHADCVALEVAEVRGELDKLVIVSGEECARYRGIEIDELETTS